VDEYTFEQKGKQTIVYVPVATQAIKSGQVKYIISQLTQKVEEKICIECGQENNAEPLSCILCSGSRFRDESNGSHRTLLMK